MGSMTVDDLRRPGPFGDPVAVVLMVKGREDEIQAQPWYVWVVPGDPPWDPKPIQHDVEKLFPALRVVRWCRSADNDATVYADSEGQFEVWLKGVRLGEVEE